MDGDENSKHKVKGIDGWKNKILLPPPAVTKRSSEKSHVNNDATSTDNTSNSSSVSSNNGDDDNSSTELATPNAIINDNNNNDVEDTSWQPIIGLNNGWELTWPIWHMLPRADRRALAHRHGYKTIGEFEEYMTLQRAVGDTTTEADNINKNNNSVPYNNDWFYDNKTNNNDKHQTLSTRNDCNHVNQKKIKNKKHDEEHHDDDNNSVDNDKMKENEMESEQLLAAGEMPMEQLMRLGGKMLMLPDEMLHRVFEWLPVDTYATLALVSPHWKSFTRTEAVYKRLCERIYLQQSKRRALHVGRFKNSYRIMLEQRPRLRAGGGVYVMKYSRVKPIQRDMWTEIPVGAVLEMTYYRYLYFQEDGRVLYALSVAPPHEIFRRFLRVCLTHEADHEAVWGTYKVQKTSVLIEAKQSWQYVQLELSIRPENMMHGRYGYLSFDKHRSSISGNFESWSNDLITYDVPDEPFRFIKERRL